MSSFLNDPLRRPEREPKDIAIGPVVFNIEEARAHGWSDDRIRAVWHAIVLVVRGASMTARFREGSMCEICGGADVLQPAQASKYCDACNRSTRS